MIEREPDAMIGHTVLRKIVGANFLLAAAAADLTLAMGGIFFLLLALLGFEQTRPQNAQRFLLVLLLTASVLAAHDCAGRNMQNLHGRIGRVDTLPPRPACPANFDAKL